MYGTLLKGTCTLNESLPLFFTITMGSEMHGTLLNGSCTLNLNVKFTTFFSITKGNAGIEQR